MDGKFNLEFDCPQFLDFKQLPSDENAEHYFAVDHENFKIQVNNIHASTTTLNQTCNSKTDETDFPVHKGPFVFQAKPQVVQQSKVPIKKRKPTQISEAQKIQPRILRSSGRRFEIPESRDPYTQVDFKAMLRKNNDVKTEAKRTGKVTVTKPFQFAESRKRKLSEPVEPYVSMAEKLLRFQKERGTPEAKNTSSSTLSSTPGQKVTRPLTPKLRVLARHRDVTILSQKQREDVEAEEMKKSQFKAQPVNPNIYAFKDIKLEKKKPTVPNFELPSEKLLAKHVKPVVHLIEPRYKFRARPAPKNILDHTVGVAKKLKISPTRPQTPNFALRERANKWTEREIEHEKLAAKAAEEAKANQAKKPSHPENSVVHQSFDKKPTAPAPFSFYEKDLERFSKKQEKIMKEIEETSKIPEFHAHPLPSPSIAGVPAKKKAPTTEVVPFNLIIDYRGQQMAEKWQNQVEEELRQQREAMKFKAQPNAVVFKKGFKPKKSEKPLAEVMNIKLNTENRARTREEFDELVKQKQDEMERERLAKEMEKEEEEKSHMEELRAQLVHKAHPVRHFPPISVKPSEKSLTVPLTPQFETEKRLRRVKENL